MREYTFFKACKKHHRELQAFCSMQGHEHDTIFTIYLVGVGNKRNLFKEVVDGIKLFCETNEFRKVL